jgi:hypothetical protein
MFRAAHRSSSEDPNCICSLWFIYPCGDRPMSRLGGNSHHQELQTVFAASGLNTNLVTSRCPGWVGVPTQPGQRPVTTWVYKPDAANTVRAPDDERYAARNMLSLQ